MVCYLENLLEKFYIKLEKHREITIKLNKKNIYIYIYIYIFNSNCKHISVTVNDCEYHSMQIEHEKLSYLQFTIQSAICTLKLYNVC